MGKEESQQNQEWSNPISTGNDGSSHPRWITRGSMFGFEFAPKEYILGVVKVESKR